MSAKRSLSRRPSSSSRSALESASGGRERTRSACRDTVNRCRIRSRYTTPRFSANARHALLSPICGMSAATALIAPPGSGRLRSAAPVPHIVFLGIDDQLRVLELAAQTGVLAIELLDLPGRRIRLRPPSLWGQRHAIGRIHLLAPAREHRGINALAAQERAEGAGLLATVGLGEQRTLLAGRELAAPGGRDNLRVGCRRGPGHPFPRPTGSLRDAQGRSRGSAVHRRVHYCCHLWILPLDTKLPKAVVPGHIGTQGIRIGRIRVARLMRAANLQRVWPHRFVITTFSAPGAKPALDLVDRAFYAEAPDRLWVADVTYIPIWTGFLYLAAVLDVYSRKIVGWAMESHLRTELVLAAIDMAIAQRRAVGVIHHSDHGC